LSATREGLYTNSYSNTNFEYLIFLIFLGILPFVYADMLRDMSALPRYAILGFVPGLLITSILLKRKLITQDLHLPRILIVIGLFVMWGAISVIWSVDSRNTLTQSLQGVSFFLLLLLTIKLHSSTVKITATIYLLITTATLVSLTGLAQYYGQNIFGYTQYAAPAASFMHRNIAAQYLNPLIPLFLLPILLSRKPSVRWLASLGMSLSMGYLLVIQTRGAILGLIIATVLAIVLILRNKNLSHLVLSRLRSSYRQLLVIPVVCLILAGYSNENKVTPITKDFNPITDTSTQIRLNSFRNAVDMIVDRPAHGSGWGSFGLAFRDYMFSSRPVPQVSENNYMLVLHNDFLQTIAELGLPAAALLLLALYYLIQMSKSCLHTDRSNDQAVCIILLMGITTFVVHSMFSFPFHRPTSAAVFTVLLGILIKLSNHSNLTTRIKLGPSRNVISIALLAGFIVVNYAFYSNYLENSARLNLGYYQLNKALGSRNPGDKMQYCKLAMHNARQIDYEFSAYSKILLPTIYANCAEDIQEQYAFMSHAIQYEPANVTARLARGAIYARTGHPERALHEFERVIQVLPNRSGGYIGKAESLLKMGRTSQARILFEKALELDPDNQRVLNSLDAIRKGNK